MFSPHEIRDVAQAGKDRDPGWYAIHRRLSIQITARLIATPVTLNQISACMLALGALGAALNASSHLLVNALGWACLYGAFLLDKVDGEVARLRRQQSVVGILLDRFHHRLVEPLLFLALGWRAFTATHSPLPLLAALATMLAANIIEETQQLPPFIAAKHARETRAWPVSGRAPSARWERAAAWMRPLKTFRMFITVLPLVAGAELLEAFTHRPATTWLLVTSAVALWLYVIFQSCYFVAGRLEADIDTLTRELPPLPAGEPEAASEPEAPAEPAVIVEPATAERPVAWPLPRRPRRSVTLAVEQADAERARTPRPDVGPLSVLLLLALLAGRAKAGTYHVGGANPCSSTGPGTLAQPYCTISAALAAHHAPGDSILVEPGVYRETVTISTSGTSGAPIVLRANGPGVVIDGADDFSAPDAWAPYAGDVWLAASVTWSPLQAFADGARLAASSTSPDSLAPGTFRYVAGQGLYVNAGGGNPGSHGTAVGHRTRAFVLSHRSWITIDGFTTGRTEDRCFSITNSSSDLDILNCTATFANKYGFYVSDGTRVRVAGCIATDNNNHGFVLTGGSTNCLIENNEGARNAVPGIRSANGLYVYNSTGNTMRRNRWHDNQDTGQDFQAGASNNLSYDNVSWKNGDHGYDHLAATGNIHLNDVAYGNYKDGFSIEGNSPGNELTNCIAVDNGLTTNEFDLWVDGSSVPGFESDDNIFWNSTSQQPVKFIATLYATLAPYQEASGQDSRTLQADPRFASPAAGDFHLLAGSPAIDNGNSSSPDWPATDADGNARVDDPAMPDSGLGPITYSDRGAFEYQPPNQPPLARLIATPLAGHAPLQVSFDASGSSDVDGMVTSYAFDFGDGTVAGPQPGATATHVFGAGSYAATVTVTDDKGASTVSAPLAVGVSPPNQPPVAVLAVSPRTGNAPLTVNASASGSSDPEGGKLSYRFDFGDSTVVGPQALPSLAHQYAAGTWTLRLVVSDPLGATGSVSTTVIVAATGPGLNLVGNPSFETDTTGWSATPGASVARAAGGFAGNWSLRVSGPPSLAAFGIDDSTPWIANAGVAGAHFRLGAWVRSSTAQGSITLQAREVAGGGPVGAAVLSAPVRLTPNWQFVTVDAVTQVYGAALDFRLLDQPLGVGEVFSVDDLTIYRVPGSAQTSQARPTDSGGDPGSTGDTDPAAAPGLPAAPGPAAAPAAAAAQAAAPTRFSVSVTPSVAASRATIAFATTTPGKVRIDLYDISGRRVRRVLDEAFLAAGYHVATLDGRNDGGAALHDGVYFYQMETAERSVTGRFVLVH